MQSWRAAAGAYLRAVVMRKAEGGLHGDYRSEAGIGAPAADLAAIVSGVGDVLHAFARALRPQERARLIDLLDVLIVSVGPGTARATVPRALISILEQPPPKARLRVIPGGKSAGASGRPVLGVGI
jgi:hypothetical protein